MERFHIYQERFSKGHDVKAKLRRRLKKMDKQEYSALSSGKG